MKPFHIEAKTISDAWFQLLFNLFDNSYRQDIQKGSFENEQFRLQYPGVSVYIEHPSMDMVPVIPAGLGIDPPTTEEFNLNYFRDYIMDPELAENETYKYASRIHVPVNELKWHDGQPMYRRYTGDAHTQVAWVIDMLQKTPLTNQAVIEIAEPTDIAQCYGKDGKLDPPCLRLIDFKVIPVKSQDFMKADLVLTVSVYFRSWDLWAGFPVNLAGIEYLKQLVASECGLANGPMYAYSSGLHIYGYQEKFARIRTMRDKMEVSK